MLKWARKNSLINLTYDVALLEPIGNYANPGSFSKSYCKAEANLLQHRSGACTIKYRRLIMQAELINFAISYSLSMVCHKSTTFDKHTTYNRICTLWIGNVFMVQALVYFMIWELECCDWWHFYKNVAIGSEKKLCQWKKCINGWGRTV